MTYTAVGEQNLINWANLKFGGIKRRTSEKIELVINPTINMFSEMLINKLLATSSLFSWYSLCCKLNYCVVTLISSFLQLERTKTKQWYINVKKITDNEIELAMLLRMHITHVVCTGCPQILNALPRSLSSDSFYGSDFGIDRLLMSFSVTQTSQSWFTTSKLSLEEFYLAIHYGVNFDVNSFKIQTSINVE